MAEVRKALTVAGSDSSGGAGIQADLKTFSALGVYGMSVVTALTAQNTTGVTGVMDVDPHFIERQFDAVLTDLPPDAIKTGMLSNDAIVEVVAAKLREYQIAKVVVDPVMVAKSGAPLLRSDAVNNLQRLLIPLATIITPNTEEAELLAGRSVATVEDMEEAAKALHGMGARNVLIKGGHLQGDAVDVYFDGYAFLHLAEQRIPTRDSHGTGCVLSAAITAYLAKGQTIEEAVRLGKSFVTAAIRNGLRIGHGQGPCDPLGLRRVRE